MKSDQIFTVKELVYLFIISVLVISILIYLLPNDARTTVNHISIASSVFGFSAFFITLKQIHSLKQIALQTELAVNNKLRGYNKIIFLTELSSKISLISEIKGHLRKKQFEICVYRMDDFKRILANLNTRADLLDLLIDDKALSAISRNYRMDMNSMEKKIQNSSYNVEVEKIINNMETLSSFLQNVEASIKHN